MDQLGELNLVFRFWEKPLNEWIKIRQVNSFYLFFLPIWAHFWQFFTKWNAAKLWKIGQSAPKLRENGKINLLNFRSTHLLVRFLNQNQFLTNPPLNCLVGYKRISFFFSFFTKMVRIKFIWIGVIFRIKRYWHSINIDESRFGEN